MSRFLLYKGEKPYCRTEFNGGAQIRNGMVIQIDGANVDGQKAADDVLRSYPDAFEEISGEGAGAGAVEDKQADKKATKQQVSPKNK